MAERIVGYHASHEQHPPADLLRYVQAAEAAGFGAAMCSDHLQPWSERQGQSGFAWSWLGAVMQATSLSYGTVNAPGQRYHPVIIAQAAATLAQMYPDRFWIAVGSGEALNEEVTGEGWPAKDLRNTRLRECVEIMRALWAGETVTHRGLVTVENARLWTLPPRPPLIVGAAITPETARWLGSWADGLITIPRQGEEASSVIDAFRDGGGDGKPAFLQVALSFAATDAAALAAAHDQWRTNILGSSVLADIASTAAFDTLAQTVRPEDVAKALRVSADPQRHVAWLEEDFDLGFDRLYLHDVDRDQERFIDEFGSKVLPALRSR